VTHFSRAGWPFDFPPGALELVVGFSSRGLGSATVNTVLQLPGLLPHLQSGRREIRQPGGRNIPRRRSCCRFAGNRPCLVSGDGRTSILGRVCPVGAKAQNSQYIVSTFVERLYGNGAAAAFRHRDDSVDRVRFFLFYYIIKLLTSSIRRRPEDGKFLFPVYLPACTPPKHFSARLPFAFPRRPRSLAVQRLVPPCERHQGDYRRAHSGAVSSARAWGVNDFAPPLGLLNGFLLRCGSILGQPYWSILGWAALCFITRGWENLPLGGNRSDRPRWAIFTYMIQAPFTVGLWRSPRPEKRPEESPKELPEELPQGIENDKTAGSVLARPRNARRTPARGAT